MVFCMYGLLKMLTNCSFPSAVGVLFDILFNLHKFMRFETRDPFQEKIRREDSFQTDWDRYAHMEYTRLSQEEEDGAAYTVSQDLLLLVYV